MPRRKGHGISPTKRATQSKDEVQIKKKAADNNEDPGGGEEEGTAATRVSTVAAATNDVNNKYLHKKFKKMATTSSPPPPSQSPPPPLVNGEPRDISSVPPSSSSSSCSSPPSVPQGRYVCPYCKLACAKPSVLQKHVRAHTNERPFPCHPCGFAFKTKSNLYKHCRSRAHALKMEEEGGTKLNIPFAESSDDLEEEPEDTSSNNTPPPVPVVSTPAATSMTTTTTSQERPRQIYKPKFHKAALYQEEEQQQQQQSATAANLTTATKSTTFPSPDFLQRHISKIINDNDEIVGPKKFLHREQLREDSPASPLSSSSSPGVDPAVLWPKKLYQRQLSVGGEQSRLANALLRPAPSPVDVQPLNLSKPERRRYNSEGTGSVTVLKDHNSTNNQRPPALLKNTNDKLPIHPQNPEGSIIKDLLLRQRGGLAISASGVPVTLEMLNYVEDPQFMCSLCKIPYRSAENLEIHQRYYCKGEGSLKSYSPQHSPLMYRAPEEGARAPQPLKPPKKTKCPSNTSPIHIVPPFPSPGPHLGNTPLVDTAAYHMARHDDLAEEHPRRKRSRLESEHSRDSSCTSSPATTPIPGIISPSTATLKTLEELSKFPMRTNSNSNSLPPFGGEVQILDGAGEKKTMRIESSSCGVKSPCSTSDIIFGMPNHVLISSAVSKSALADLDDDSSSGTMSPHHCTTIAKGLHSGGTIMQVSQKSSNNLETPGRVRSPRTPSLNSHSPKSPLSKPTQKNSIGASGGVMLNPSPAPSPYSTTVFLTSSDTATMTTSFPDTSKLLVPIVPNIAAPNLAVPGIPVPQNVQFISIASVLPEVLNPLTSITAYNPLTLPPHSGIHPMPSLRLSQPPIKEKKTSPVAVIPAPFMREVNLPPPTYSGGVGTIYEDGKPIPYVPGMPGPHSLVSTIPPPIPRRKEASPKPLDLASPSREPHHQMSTDPHSGMFFPRNFKPLNLSESAPQELITTPRGPPLPPKLKEHSIPRIKVDSASMNLETAVSDQPARKISRPEILTIEVDKDEDKEVESIKLRKPEVNETGGEPQNKNKPKFLRPTTLPLKPGTFTPKKNHGVGLTPTGTVLSLISPETPRPKKSYGQLYLNGHAYTYLGLKCSTRTFHCTLTKPQPMYVPQSSEHPKLSMYSNWKICKETDPNPFGLSPGQVIALYDSRHRPATFTIAKTTQNQPLILTHSSYWLEKMSKAQQIEKAKKEKSTMSDSNRSDAATKTDSNESTSSGDAPAPKRVKIFDGGFESNEDYIYVRGRGRGRYVCEECGIRCKKPSMLKKHIRTHTDVRPFTCKHCSFSFKTKGNLTKHMKSKAHYKKCMELGIDPVPTVVDDSYIDEECLARQQALRASQRAEGESESDENEEEEEDEEEEEEEEDDEPIQGTDDGDDTSSMKGKLEREAACSLLSLSESTRVNSTSSQYVSAGLIPLSSHCGRPTTYPYNLTMPVLCQGNTFNAPQTPTLTAVSAQMEHEKVSHNTGLALELRGSADGKLKDDDARMSSTLRRRNNAALVLIPPQQGDANRYYFPSCRTPTIITNVPVSSYAKSLSGDKSSLDGGSDSEYDRDTSSAAYSDDDEKDMSDGSAKREKSIAMEVGNSASQQPMDLSNKSVTPVRKISSTMFPYFPPASGARTPTTPISEILTPVSEPATLLASLCSSVERFPVPTHKVPDPAETTMLQAYLTERALQDARIKQHQQFHNHHGYSNKGSSNLQEKPASITKKNLPIQKEILPHRPVPLKIPQPITEAQKLKVSEALVHDASSPRQEIPVSEIGPEKPPPIKPKDTIGTKLQGGLVSMSNNNIVRNVVVSGIGFTSHQPSSPPTSTTGTTTMSKNSSSGKLKAEFLPPSSGPSASYVSMTEDGRSICVICNKIFSKPSQLRLHVNIHYFERPFRCESCAVSFRTKGHLQKHERSVSHQNKVSMNSTFGTPTTTNPRPFKCDDCKIAFRIHGHLAKHLRSKMHIMKLECVGKLPFGTYAEMEREGISLNEIDTTDCDNSLESLQVLAQRLYEKDPSKLGQWDGERVDMIQSHPVPHMSGGETSSDEGEPLLGCQTPPANMAQVQRDSRDVTFGQQDDLSESKKGMSSNETNQQLAVSDWSNSVTKLQVAKSSKGLFVNDVTTNGSNCQQNSVQSEEGDYEDTSDGDNDVGNSNPKFTCTQCPQVFTSMGALHVHSFVEHDSGAETADEGSAQCTRTAMDSGLGHFRKRPKALCSYEDPSLFGPATKRPMFEQHVKTSGGYLTLMCGVNSDEQARNECHETIAQGVVDSERIRYSPISGGESAKCDDVSASSRQYSESDTGNPQAKLNCDLQAAAVQSGHESYHKELQSPAQNRTVMHDLSSAGFVMQQSSSPSEASQQQQQQQGKDN